jgi:isopropylmalate/homocitrate/citramalate synthase
LKPKEGFIKMSKNGSNEKPWIVPGKWYMSPYNWEEDVRIQMPNLPAKVEIRDVTFRECDDQMGLYLTIEDRVKLALKVAEAGIKEIDVGGPKLLPHQGKACRAIRDAYDEAGIDKTVTRISARYFAVARDPRAEIDAIMAAGATDVRCVVMSPSIVGDAELHAQLARMPEAVKYCHEKYGATITVGMDDTSGTPKEYIPKVYTALAECGVDKAWFSDTLALATPSAQRYLAVEIRKYIGRDMPLACHIHNHHGMGTATTLGAVEGGTTEPDCTWNGYGDQGGNACLEEVVCNLESLYGVHTGVKLEKLTEISEMVERMCGVETQYHKAFTGKGAFAFMSYDWAAPLGMVLAGVSKAEIEKRIEERKKIRGEDYRFNPVLLGRKIDFCWGSYGSRQPRVVKAKLEMEGVPYKVEDIRKILDALAMEVDRQVASNKELMSKKQPAYLTDEEFMDLARRIIRS